VSNKLWLLRGCRRCGGDLFIDHKEIFIAEKASAKDRELWERYRRDQVQSSEPLRVRREVVTYKCIQCGYWINMEGDEVVASSESPLSEKVKNALREERERALACGEGRGLPKGKKNRMRKASKPARLVVL
jgi:predicted  nucleic acid-binding Zn-ribbon protein